ncbi:alpha/beta hydrolase [Rhodococcus sp. 06-221-2]|uniref:alpha/beta hydrolase n=1 Tax=Nocardiaceae TaxID=85025 RepID=UPI000B9A7953|nr:alpha/beta hydrolase [Rhodococcus sp. 06-221-2]NIL84640.1 Uncharacterized protein [Rhodococcus fascians]NIL91563.1 hypothetical protein [Rhodococcus fascians]OZD00353.1 alpha/beta hydrolase [Rhodococcus sp. 06-221-2]
MKKSVEFHSDGAVLVGHLYIPEDLQAGEQRPSVVVVSPGSGIKEQTSGRYADELHRRGLVALAFDHRTYGESEGSPRFDENPYAKTEDIKNAVSFLGNQSEVSRDRIGAMGICGGGGYAPYAAATDRRIKAVATVSGMTNNRASFEEMSGGDRSITQAMLDASSAARQSFSRGEPAQYGPVILPADSPHTPEVFTESPNYYFDDTRGGHPRWENKVLAWSLERQMTFNALDVIHLIAPRPLLLVVGTESASRDQNERAYAAAGEPRELALIDGASHIDLYDVDRYVTPVADRLAEFFCKHL